VCNIEYKNGNIVKKDGFQVAFDQKVNCKNGFVCGIDLNVQMAKTSVKCPDNFKKSVDITMRHTKITTKMMETKVKKSKTF